MPEPFKNCFNKSLVSAMAGHFLKQYHNFDSHSFVTDATTNMDSLELKARSELITQTMVEYLPADFTKSSKILLDSLGTNIDEGISNAGIDENGIAGWAIMPMAHYVALKGQDHFDLSMELLKEMTKRFTSELAIRYFILKSTTKTLSTLRGWSTDDNQHVRRLVSEGSRPRLPWAMRLPMFISDPSPILELLEILKDDPSEYVRRSVANNLNDISKDHPDLVAEIAGQWMKNASKQRIKLVKHACRTLVKKGDKKILSTLGFNRAKIKKPSIELNTPTVNFGDYLEFTFSAISDSNQDQPLIIDYIIHHKKKSGQTSPKVFKWKLTTLLANKKLVATKKHAIKKITTRKYYQGEHRVEIIVNGVSFAEAKFSLLMP
ncbi:MAG: DNA alkylation repair protein [Magnetococcales bacterium]|nr:DNA alkylation repair protein [Magnetococcales bacterium]